MNSLDLTLSTAINAGRITGTNIHLDGRPVDMPGQPANAPPIVYGPDGWSEHETVIGGRRSKGVDALAIALVQNNYLDVADRLPAFHVFVNPPDGGADTVNLGNDPATLVALDPVGRSPIERQEQENVRAVHTNYFGQLIANDPAVLAAYYRGGEKGEIPRYLVGNNQDPATRKPFTARPGSPDDQALDLDERYKPHAKQTAAAKYPNVDKPVLQQNDIEATAPFKDHFVYDLLFDTSTDAAVTRFWASWIRALGINLSKAK